MQVLEAIKKLENSDNYKEWQKDNVNSYLSYAFVMMDINQEKQDLEWQIGYYLPKEDKITTFTIDKEIRKNPDSEIFKNNTKVYELKIDKLKVACRDAWKISDKMQKEKYPFLTPLKKITILQKLDIGQLWNIT